MKKKAILIGAYGCGNKGDDAILEGIISSLAERYDFTVVTGNYGGIEQKFNVETIKCRMNEGISVAVIANLLFFFPQYIVQCIKSDCVLIGGGSLLHDITRYNLLFFALLQKIAQLFGKKVIYIGVGAGPISTDLGKWICKNIVGKSEKVFIRDMPDYKLLTDIGMTNVELIADMAFTVDTDEIFAKDVLETYGLTRKKYIAMTACEWFKSDNFWNKENMNFNEQKAKLAEVIIQIQSIANLPIVFLPTVFHDYKLAKELQNMITTGQFIVLPHTYDCSQMAAVVAESKFLFGIRMHSLIFAIRAGVPFLTSIYDKKVESLVKRCDMDKYAFDFEKVSETEIRQLVVDILQNSEDVSVALKKKAMELKSFANKAINYLNQN